MKKGFWRKAAAAGIAAAMMAGLAACGSSSSSAASTAETVSSETETETAAAGEGSTQVQVFIAASLNDAMTEIADSYMEAHPDVDIVLNADSSGKLMTQIQEGAAADIFFSAAEKQMDTLEQDGLLVDGTRADVVSNTLCVITYKDSGTAVTGLENLGDASSLAIADGSVPVGKYTRQALVNIGVLDPIDDVSTYTTQQLSDALGGVEISEQGNVSKVLTAVEEQSCEVGTVYYSDTYGHDDIEIIQQVDPSVSGDITYPIAQIVNQDADDTETAAAADFLSYIQSDEALQVLENYQFIVK